MDINYQQKIIFFTINNQLYKYNLFNDVINIIHYYCGNMLYIPICEKYDYIYHDNTKRYNIRPHEKNKSQYVNLFCSLCNHLYYYGNIRNHVTTKKHKMNRINKKECNNIKYKYKLNIDDMLTIDNIKQKQYIISKIINKNIINYENYDTIYYDYYYENDKQKRINYINDMNKHIIYLNSIKHKKYTPFKYLIYKYKNKIDRICETENTIRENLYRLTDILLIKKIKNRYYCSKEKLEKIIFQKFICEDEGPYDF